MPYATVIGWRQAGKDKILKEQHDALGTEKLPLIWRMPEPRKANVEDLKKENKALKAERLEGRTEGVILLKRPGRLDTLEATLRIHPKPPSGMRKALPLGAAQRVAGCYIRCNSLLHVM